jgi:type IV secretion system protein TrbL
MSCNPLDPAGCVAAAVGSGIDQLAQTYKDGAEWAMQNLTTAWLHAPAPDVSSATSVTGWIQEHLSYFVAATMLFSVLVAAYRLATTGKFEHGRDLAESLTRVVVVTAIAGTLTTLGVQIGELFSTWILGEANIDFSQTVVLGAITNSGIVLILAFIVILAQIIQLGLMMIRSAMIIILAGVLPLSAAAGNTQMGRQWWQKSFAWLLAFVLYKPVAALIYAASFKMVSQQQDIATQISSRADAVLGPCDGRDERRQRGRDGRGCRRRGPGDRCRPDHWRCSRCRCGRVQRS